MGQAREFILVTLDSDFCTLPVLAQSTSQDLKVSLCGQMRTIWLFIWLFIRVLLDESLARSFMFCSSSASRPSPPLTASARQLQTNPILPWLH
jgi:hypothetical protein